jgi:aryl-alcohol dehydrogenase-like predicted oxidoreductase
MNLTRYRTLGRSGLAVSPLALGTMTFGAAGWGAGEGVSRSLFDAYVEAGGNFIDTADIYSAGRSEEMLGRFMAESGMRDGLVIATKSGFARGAGGPHLGGNGRKNIRQSLDASLQRLKTDYIDMYWMHVWDRTTPVEEVLETLAGAVRAGKILHYGFSNTPAWYVSRLSTLAEAHGLPRPTGLQYGYSLVDRAAELELLPAGEQLGLGLVPWSPLAAGLLTGKYGREMLAEADRLPGLPVEAAEAETGRSEGRLAGDNPFGGMLFTERNFAIVDALRGVADDIGRSMAEVALAWVVQRPGVSSVLLGASRPEQLTQNLASLDVELDAEHLARLEAASALPLLNPYFIFQLPVEMFFGGQKVRAWQA